jgi:hypothetical protein
MGWDPLPLEAVDIAAAIPGIVSVRPRTWGAVMGPDGPVTVMAADRQLVEALRPFGAADGPNPGEAIVGRQLQFAADRKRIDLGGVDGRRSFQVKAVLDARADAVAFDLVVLDETDARFLLGLPDGHVSDLAVDVYHEQELAAMMSDLSSGFPWTVSITTRAQTRRHYRSFFGRRSTLLAGAVVSAAVALALLVVSTLRDRIQRRGETRLFKAFGWSTADLIAVETARSGVVALCAGAIGSCVAYGVVFGFGTPWVTALLFGWQGPVPDLVLAPGGALVVLIEIAAFILIPYLTAAVSPLLIHAARPAEEWSFYDTGP